MTTGFQQQGPSFVNPSPLKTAASPQAVGKKLKDEPSPPNAPQKPRSVSG